MRCRGRPAASKVISCRRRKDVQDKIDEAIRELNTVWASCRDYGGKVARPKMTEMQWAVLLGAAENLGSVVAWAERNAGEKEGE